MAKKGTGNWYRDPSIYNKKSTMSFTCTEEMEQRIIERAKESGLRVSAFIRQIMEKGLATNDGENAL